MDSLEKSGKIQSWINAVNCNHARRQALYLCVKLKIEDLNEVFFFALTRYSDQNKLRQQGNFFREMEMILVVFW